MRHSIGMVMEADGACCCKVPVSSGPGACHTVASGDACGPYEQYSEGACEGTPPNTPTGGCSTAGVRSGTGDVGTMEGFVLVLALAAFRATWRRFASRFFGARGRSARA